MKKIYNKPQVMIERFSIVHTGARDCSDNLPKEFITLSDLPKCKWDLGSGITYFLYEYQCTIDGEYSSGACYNNPSEDMLLFHS